MERGRWFLSIHYGFRNPLHVYLRSSAFICGHLFLGPSFRAQRHFTADELTRADVRA